MKICDLMTKAPVCCSMDTTIEDVARMMLTNDCGSIPVTEGEGVSRRIVGILTDRDIVVRAIAAGKCPLELKASELMSRPVAVLVAEESIESAMKLLEDNQVRRAPVVDQSGQIVGVVAQADLARSMPLPQAGELVQSISQGMDIGHL